MTSNAADSRLKRWLDPLALLLIVTFVTYRTVVSSLQPTLSAPEMHSTNFFASSLGLIAASIWLLARTLDGGFVFRGSKTEFATFGLLVACAVSIGSASYILLAADYALSLSTTVLVLYMGSHMLGRPRAGLVLTLFISLGLLIVTYGLLQRFVLLADLPNDPAAAALMRTVDGRERLERMQPFSVFLSPNQFGFFCVFLVLALAGSTIDAWRKKSIVDHIPFKAALALAALAGLYFSSSKGSWVALGVGAAFMGFLGIRRLHRKASWVFLGVVIVASSAAAVAMSQTDSMRLRYSYWEAAGKVAELRPMTGIGLGNYREYHAQYKAEQAPDTKLVHNDYLQILCELGILGLLSILGFGAGVVRGLGWGPPVAAAPQREGFWLPGLGIGLGIVAAWLLNDQFTSKGSAAIMVMLLVSTVLMFYWRRNREEALLDDPQGLRIGLAGGMVALLAHMIVDFDFYEHSLLVPVFLACGLGLASGGKTKEIPVDRTAASVIAAFFLIVTLGGIYSSMKLFPSDTRKRLADDRVEEFAKSGDNKDLAAAADLLDEAARQNTWDADLFARRSLQNYRAAQLFRPRSVQDALKGRTAPLETQDKELLAARERWVKYAMFIEKCFESLEAAIVLRPRNEAYRIRYAEVRIEWGDLLWGVAALKPEASGREEQAALSQFQAALRYLEEARDLAPDIPYVYYRIGEATLKMKGREKLAAEAFRRAKKLHESAGVLNARLTDEQVKIVDDFLKRAE